MLGSLLKEGAEITNDPAQADVVIVNTCSFIDAAQEESVDAILESAELREVRNREQGLIVSGCMPQRFRDELPKLLPEVDAFMGVDQVSQVGEIVQKALERRAARRTEPRKKSSRRKRQIVGRLAELSDAGSDHEKKDGARGHERDGSKPALSAQGDAMPDAAPIVQINARPRYIPDYATPRFRLTPRHFAYLKIAEGCNHPCSFCTIPRMRGAHRSRPQEDVVREAEALIAEGVKELNLISQDSTYYGLDLRPNRHGSIASPDRFNAAARSLPANATTLCTLLRLLNRIEGDFWIRLLYTHPAHWTDELIEAIAGCDKVPRYIDMPLQHIHPVMLERMRRETSREHIVDLIRRIRSAVPGIAIRTTFIVGFPGETESYFQSLLDFIRETRFERLGIFTYSQEEGTRAANMMGQVSDLVKRERRERAMAEQLKLARTISESFVGRELKVLVERKATDQDLSSASIRSWEHGQLRHGGPEDVRKELHFGKTSYVVARGEADAPDIDGRVYVVGRAPIGEFTRVRVVGHTDYDLIARPV